MANYVCLHTNVEGDVGLQQNDASQYTSHATIDFLRQTFDGHLISQNCDLSWRDLTALECNLGGDVKECCHDNKPKTIDDLKVNIRDAIAVI